MSRRKTKWALEPGDWLLTHMDDVEAHVVLDEDRNDGYLWIGGPKGPCVGHMSGKKLRELRDTLNTLALNEEPADQGETVGDGQ